MLSKPETKTTDAAAAATPEGPVLFTLIHQFTDVIGGLARHLRDSCGVDSALAYIGPLPNSAVYHLSPSDFAELVDYGPVMMARRRDELPPISELVAQAEATESKYGVRILEIIRADRHLGQSFANGADVPRSRFSDQFDSMQALDLCLRLFTLFDDLVRRLRPRVVVTIPGDAARMVLTAVAESAGIPIRVPGPNFSNNGFQWRVDRHFWPAGLADAYAHERRLPASRSDQGQVAVRDFDRTEYARRAIRSGASISVPMRAILLTLRRQAGDIVKRRRRRYGGYRVGGTIRAIIATWRERRRQLMMPPVGGRLSSDQPYVFLPLAVEPETTLQCESPMCDNQLVIIDWLAKTLPGGWRLLVKEHPAFTYPRPRFFWEQIRRYPNVDIAAMHESGERLCERARIVAVINGTLGIQAAAGGIPVLTFNPKWWGRFLPHVAYAGSYEETAAALRSLADRTNLPPHAERQRLGEALVRALDVGTIALKDPRILEEKALGEPTPAEDLSALTDALLQSLKHPSDGAAAVHRAAQ
jgi:hypothetical protein